MHITGRAIIGPAFVRIRIDPVIGNIVDQRLSDVPYNMLIR
jgi:hypothetical protein